MGFTPKPEAGMAKYVFMFIGDGMASVRIHATEAYLADKLQDDDLPGGVKAKLLSMDYFPVVGIVSSVSIDHATPAVFYAHQPSRGNYNEIAMELAHSSFDYFAE